MWRFVKVSLPFHAFFWAILFLAGQSFSATVEVQSNIRFEKSLGVRNDRDISYGRLIPSANQRISMAPSGEISSENGSSVSVSDASHSGKVVIDDGRAQQFSLIADEYTSNGAVRPLSALCSFDRNHNVPCNKIRSMKGVEAKTVFVGMVIQVLDGPYPRVNAKNPTFDLSVVYF